MSAPKQRRPNLAPTRFARLLSSEDERNWYAAMQTDLTSEFGTQFKKRVVPSVTIAILRPVRYLIDPPDHVQPTNGSLRRFVETRLPVTSKRKVEPNVRWTTSIPNDYAVHLCLSLNSPEIEDEVDMVANSLRSIGYTAVNDLAKGVHLGIGSFEPGTIVPKSAIAIVNDHKPDYITLGPVKSIRRA